MSTAFEADLKGFLAERGINNSGRFLEATTLREYERHLRRWHEKTGAETPTLRDCRTYVIEMADHSPSQAQYAYRALRRYSAWLAEGLGGTDHLSAWRMNVAVEATRTPVASRSELTALLAVCTEESIHGCRDHALISVMAYTGMRRSEVARMTWDDVDIVGGTITIPKTKTKKPRVVQMPTAAQKSLRRYMRSLSGGMGWKLPAHVWTSRKGGSYNPLTSDGIQQVLQRRSREAGVKVPAHSLRRFYAVQWLAADGSQAYLQKQAGWKDGRMVARYVSTVAEQESAKEALRIFG